ncbi:MAG TPA: outer membrane beta-barrel protein [Longimicrobium sp.]|jgi:opacity protein-like surface antigen|uniref:outer membrane beta-barrel protein n=1 Tax=Longimicrobium sp. TaxID=2029185 RepID=UPI002EDB2AAF
MRYRYLAVAALAAGTLISARPLQAQSNNRGLLVNAHLTAPALSGAGENASDKADAGYGAGGLVGYGFTDRVMLFVGADFATVEPQDEDLEGPRYQLGTGEIGLRVSFRDAGRSWRPYLTAALSAVVTNDDVEGDEVSVSGAGLTVGGGGQYFLSRRLAVDAGLNATMGSFSTIEVNGDRDDLQEGIGFIHSRMHLGLSWHP